MTAGHKGCDLSRIIVGLWRGKCTACDWNAPDDTKSGAIRRARAHVKYAEHDVILIANTMQRVSVSP